jgi:FlaA1/EpsC-like NDP-sugar epimerase
VVAEAARQHGVGVFVLVSTDKAVAPTSMLGASKRLAELVLQGMQPLVSRTRFCIVRFGNVLESSGSVVPLFREQIRSGGPVTVTHPDVTRYFMTIPEAAQLVIQAGAMSRGGDVFVLEMGKPVKIADLAARLIRLMGLTVKDKRHPAGDIGVEFTGLRPGEKLHEELLLGTSVEGTDHPKIMRATEKCFTWEQVRFVLDSLDEALERSDLIQVASLLSRVVDGYDPKGLRDHVMDAATAEPAKRAAGASITFLPGKLAAESSLSPASGDSPA